jgi:hypothetical protein
LEVSIYINFQKKKTNNAKKGLAAEAKFNRGENNKK